MKDMVRLLSLLPLFSFGPELLYAGSVFEKMLQFFLVVFQLPDIETKLPIDEYYDIFFNLHLIFGIAFQLPIVLVLLGAMGILRSAFLFSKWREVTIFLAIASAFLSPPDWVSMVALLIPLEILSSYL